jgi:anaphase-promoting complex subunit 8
VRGASEPVDDVYALAKAQFDLKEYLRAAHTLRVRAAPARRTERAALSAARRHARQGASGSKARFLRCYALYLAGEKRKTEELVEVAGPMVSGAALRSSRARRLRVA